MTEQRATRRKPTLLCLIAILLRGAAVNLIQFCSILEFCKKHPNVTEQSTGPPDHQDRVRGRNKSWTTVNQHELETCRKYYFYTKLCVKFATTKSKRYKLNHESAFLSTECVPLAREKLPSAEY
ncbi:unnamed protein product [Pylaiella littoralis]